ncbi:chemotaxis protein [Massilia sp. CF038]|uniref:chemotaxis protein n=1 Tax=Massilia sp. CF038 TaxID=1881045 RepID=UPI00091B2847|nr:chemotaxis protein [Massilia sp. CF038]SHG71140.1 two-component system, chemotaxis family, response regulator CheV [Massilia sp. CF038]
MTNLQQDIDERSNLTGLNKLELLLFRLGGDGNGDHAEIYGINVFKIREIVVMPPLTVIADSHPHMMGVVKIRDEIIPVVNLPAIVGCVPRAPLNLLLVTEFARTTQAFAVESVEEIVRLEWTDVMPADSTTASALITSIAKIDAGTDAARLAQVLDVETILRRFKAPEQEADEQQALGGPIVLGPDQLVLAADDSSVARMLIEGMLKELKINYEMVASGKQLWDRLNQIEAQAVADGSAAKKKVAMVLSDLEMPEMDGFTLTRKIKQDSRYSSIPVVIHSSLSGGANEAHVNGVGADAYIAKFVPNELADLLRKFLT